MTSPTSFPQNTSSEDYVMHCRMIYTRLIACPSHDPSVLVTLTGLWLYYQRIAEKRELTYDLCSLPSTLLNQFIKESILVLQCVTSNEFSHIFIANNNIPHTQAFTRTFVRLCDIFNNRHEILNSVQSIINEVYWIIFGDMHQVMHNRALVAATGPPYLMNFNNLIYQSQPQNLFQYKGQLDRGSVQHMQPLCLQQNQIYAPHMQSIGLQQNQFWVSYITNQTNPNPMSLSSPFYQVVPNPQSQSQNVLQFEGQLNEVSTKRMQSIAFQHNQSNITNQGHGVTNSVAKISMRGVFDDLNRLNVDVPNELHIGTDIAPSIERTIVLSFHAGHPISKREIIEFFNRTFGNCLHATHMQQGSSSNQLLLHARVTLASPSYVEHILGPEGNVVLNINGKRVRAQKLVGNNASPLATSSSGEPTSPTSALVAGVINHVLN